MQAKSEILNQKLRLILSDVAEKAEAVEAAYYQKENNDYVKAYDMPIKNVEKIRENFERLAPLMFEESNWEEALLIVARICQENRVAWFLTGSACDAVRGIAIKPHDLDVEIYSRDWEKAKDVFLEYMIEPFIDVKGWVREHFGRIVAGGMQVDVVADARYDLPHYEYEPYEWKGYTLWLEPFSKRYKTEKERNRKDRIEAFENYLKNSAIYR